MKFTNCDGVMSSEALLENPALFSEIQLSPEELSLEYIQLSK